MTKLNCWEAMACGRGPGGDRVADEGPCSAAGEVRLNQVHGGTNAGRTCWAVAGNLGRGKRDCSSLAKHDCLSCSFYERVIEEEMPHFVFTPKLLERLGHKEGDDLFWV